MNGRVVFESSSRRLTLTPRTHLPEVELWVDPHAGRYVERYEFTLRSDEARQLAGLLLVLADRTDLNWERQQALNRRAADGGAA